MGQLTLSMQNQSKDVFPSDTKKNPKDCMAMTIRNSRELESRKENEKNKTEKEKNAETREETKQGSSKLVEDTEKEEEQTKQQIEKEKLKKKEEVQASMPTIPFPQRLQKAKMEERFSRFLEMFQKIEIDIPFAKELAQMPNYAKFMKDVLRKKRKFAKK